MIPRTTAPSIVVIEDNPDNMRILIELLEDEVGVSFCEGRASGWQMFRLLRSLPDQPVERRLRLTRSVLEVLARARLPVVIVTKGSGIERDLDLLAPMAAQGLVAVYVSITTLKDALARQMEPRAAAPYRRLRTLETLAAAGIPVGVSLSPQIPFLNDEMEQVLDAAHAAGARRAFYQVLRLPWELKPLFED